MLLSEAKRILKKNGYCLIEDYDAFDPPRAEITAEELMELVEIEPENQLQKDALEIICAFYASRNLPLNGMKNWVKIDYKRFIQRGGDEKAARQTRPCVVGASLVDNDLANKFTDEQKAAEEARQAEAEEYQRLKETDPEGFYNKYGLRH